MKTLTELKKERSNTVERMNALKDERRDSFLIDQDSFEDVREYIRFANKRKERNKNIAVDVDDLEIELKLIDNNIKAALFFQVLPEILIILKKYEGKAYGPKTKARISEEVYQLTGYDFYIDRSHPIDRYRLFKRGFYSSAIEILPTVKDGTRSFLLDDNKIQVPEIDELVSPDFIPYIEDIEERREEIKQAYYATYALQKALDEACRDYNKLIPSNMDDLYYLKHINQPSYKY